MQNFLVVQISGCWFGRLAFFVRPRRAMDVLLFFQKIWLSIDLSSEGEPNPEVFCQKIRLLSFDDTPILR